MGRSLHCIGGGGDIRRALEAAGATFAPADRADHVLCAAPGADASTALALWERREDGDLLVAARRSGVLNRLRRAWLGLPYFDYDSGLRLYRGSALRRAGADPSKSVDALVRLHRAGFRVKEVPCEERPRQSGASALGWLALRRLRFASPGADEDELAASGRRSRRARKLRRRHEQVVRFLEVDVPLLDVGCGSGRLIQSIASGVGLDVDAAKLRYLRSRSPAVVAGTMTALPFREESFPQLVCTGVLERLDEIGDTLGELARVLHRGGTLIIGAPARLESGLRDALEGSGFRVVETGRPSRGDLVLRAIRGSRTPSTQAS